MAEAAPGADGENTQPEDALRYVARDVATTLLILAGAVVTRLVTDEFEVSGPTKVILNISELTLACFFLVSLLYTLRHVVVAFSALLDALHKLGPVRATVRFLKGMVPDAEHLSQAFKLGVASALFITVYVAVALVTPTPAVLIPVGIVVGAFVLLAIYVSFNTEMLHESGGGAGLVLLVMLMVAAAIIFVGVPIALGVALWATGSTEPVTDFILDLLRD